MNNHIGKTLCNHTLKPQLKRERGPRKDQITCYKPGQKVHLWSVTAVKQLQRMTEHVAGPDQFMRLSHSRGAQVPRPFATIPASFCCDTWCEPWTKRLKSIEHPFTNPSTSVNNRLNTRRLFVKSLINRRQGACRFKHFSVLGQFLSPRKWTNDGLIGLNQTRIFSVPFGGRFNCCSSRLLCDKLIFCCFRSYWVLTSFQSFVFVCIANPLLFLLDNFLGVRSVGDFLRQIFCFVGKETWPLNMQISVLSSA